MEKITLHEYIGTVAQYRFAVMAGTFLTTAAVMGIASGVAAVAELLTSQNGVMPDGSVFDHSVVNDSPR